MRHNLARVCASAIVLALCGIGGASSAAPTRKSDAGWWWTGAPSTCLGGVLNDGPVDDYLTLSDYPAYAHRSQRVLVCGDSIPPHLFAHRFYGQTHGSRGR